METAQTHTADAADSASRSRREVGKAQRRQRIIQAARELIRETGNTGLSMRALAARAGVSLATPYNLFGSKRAIVLALLHDVRAFNERFSSLRSADPLERIFSAVDMAASFYVEDPAFYKILWAAVFETGDEVRTAIYNPKRDAFWQKLIADAAAAGALLPEMDQDLLLRQLDYQFRSVMLDWVVGDLGADALAPMLRLGYALILNGACAPDWRGPLQLRIFDNQAALCRVLSR